MSTARVAALGGPRAWTRDTLREDDWLLTLPAAWTDGVRADRAGGLRPAGQPPPPHLTEAPHPAEPPEFPAGLLARLAEQLTRGPGFAVVRGGPLTGLSDARCLDLAHRFAARLGTPRPPDAPEQGHALLTSRLPAGHPAADAVRGGVDDRDLALHTDRGGPPGPPRLLGLLCVRQAAHGGASLLAGGATVHDRLLARHPAVLGRLYRDFRFGRGDGFDRVHPVFERSAGEVLTRYNRYWIERGHREAGESLSAGDRTALDAFDEILADPGTVLSIRLRPGDFLLLDNTAVLHGRTAFTDTSGDPLRRRCLVRVWVDRPTLPGTGRLPGYQVPGK
ncbi:TauD/TfdA family dioxygenase [Streptomyces lavendofoliae]|uniref:TauD/TfdA family dioxygenase n=1 Tax=Streptomyces lavendofoliae TaxID=67314 RepID=UPI00300F1C8D